MKAYDTEHVKCVALVGHGAEGKTTLTEAMLYCAKQIDRMGKVEDGSASMDYDPEEVKRHISINAGIASFQWNDSKINIIDAPGYFDFVGELIGSLHLADSAILVLSAASGLAVGTEKAYEYCETMSKPRMFFVNQMDKEHSDFDKAVVQLQSKYGNKVVPFQLPILNDGKLTGIIDIIEKKAYDINSNSQIDIPANLKQKTEDIYAALLESSAENIEELLEKYFAGEELTTQEVINGLKKGIAEANVVPVFMGIGQMNKGVKQLLDAIEVYAPSMTDLEPPVIKDSNGEEKLLDYNGPFVAQVIKTIADPFVGKLSIFKVYAGTLKPDTTVFNTNQDNTEKLGTLYSLCGKKHPNMDLVVPGDIAAVSKLQYTKTGDTLCDPKSKAMLEPIVFPNTAIEFAVYSLKEGDEDKVFSGLRKLEEEDLTLKTDKNVETGEMILKGIGELHLEVILGKLKNKFGAEAVLKQPKIPYRETIRSTVKAEGKHKKQSGGHGQYGHCWLQFDPYMEGDFEFVDKIVGGVVPRQYIPAVEKGLKESLEHGVLAGYPVVGIRCTLYDGSYHPVDSSEMAFKIAAHLAFKKGCQDAKPVLMEPVYSVAVLVPEEYMGDIIGDLNKRRGRILGMGTEGNMQKVEAEVPLAEMTKYATDLRSITHARGSYSMKFVRYEDIPANISKKIIETATEQAV